MPVGAGFYFGFILTKQTAKQVTIQKSRKLIAAFCIIYKILRVYLTVGILFRLAQQQGFRKAFER